MTVPAPDVLRAEIDRRLADCDRLTRDDTSGLTGLAAAFAPRPAHDRAWVAERRAYLVAFRAILDEHESEQGWCVTCYDPRTFDVQEPCPTRRAVAAALTREES